MRSILARIVSACLGAVAVDLAAKALAEAILPLRWPQPIVGEWFRLTLVYNEGTAFGLFATEGPGVLIVNGLATLLLVAWLLYTLHTGSHPLPALWALGLLLGGAVGNLIDRLADGRVTDFLDFGIGTHRFAAFNLADVFILVGVGLFLLCSYTHRPIEENADENPTSSDEHEERT